MGKDRNSGRIRCTGGYFPVVLAALLLLVLGMTGGGCSMGGAAPSGDFFWAQSLTPGGWYPVYADRLAVGEYSEVWVDRASGSGVDSATAQAITDTFDTAIYGPIRSAFGRESDVDGNGRIVILVLDIRDGYTAGSGSGYIAGYFDSTHLFGRSSYARSNETDMVFMDCDPLVPGNSTFYSTLAHEFQHLISYNRNVFEEKGAEQEIWLNEGLSSAAESVYLQGFVDWKVSFFTNAAKNGDISRGASFLRWDGSLSSYATAYLFFQWLRIQEGPADDFTGDGLFLSIQESRHPDYRAVEETSGRAGDSWETILRDWYAANYFSAADIPDPRYGYKGRIRFRTDKPTLYYRFPFLQDCDDGVGLYPGGGVYRKAAAAGTVSGDPGIRYVRFSDAGPGTADASLPVQEGDVFLAFNVSPRPRDGVRTTGALPAAVPEELESPDFFLPAQSLAGNAGNPDAGYPIDAVFPTGGGGAPAAGLSSGGTLSSGKEQRP